jgi:hypothetical protein
MEKLIGYTLPSDIEEFKQDGFIRVLIEPEGNFAEKVEFTDKDIRASVLTSDDLDDFLEGYFVSIENFTHKGKQYRYEDTWLYAYREGK